MGHGERLLPSSSPPHLAPPLRVPLLIAAAGWWQPPGLMVWHRHSLNVVLLLSGRLRPPWITNSYSFLKAQLMHHLLWKALHEDLCTRCKPLCTAISLAGRFWCFLSLSPEWSVMFISVSLAPEAWDLVEWMKLPPSSLFSFWIRTL